jgi:hypothetical protein
MHGALDSMPILVMFAVSRDRIDLFADVPSALRRFDDESNVMSVG